MRLVDLLLEDLADPARLRVDLPRELNHRIIGILDGLQSSLCQALADRHIFERGAMNQFRGAIARRFSGQHHLNDFIFLAHHLGHHSQ